MLLPPLWAVASLLVQGLVALLGWMAAWPLGLWNAAAAPPWGVASGLLAPTSGTVEVKDIHAGPNGSNPVLFYPAVGGGYFYFSADDGSNGVELWRTDGTATGTNLVANIATGAASSSPTSRSAALCLLLAALSPA